MSTIISTRSIALPAERVYATAKQVERFAEVLPNVDSVRILEDRGGGQWISEWQSSFKLGPLAKQVNWTEHDSWDDAALCNTFELVRGDMKRYSGTWRFTRSGDGCEVELKVDFELGIPLIGPLISNIVDQLMQQNCDELLKALEDLARK